MTFSRVSTAALVAIALCTRFASADQGDDRSAIEQAVQSYTEAFNKGNAEALAAHWSPNAVYTNPLTGETVRGREAITKQFEMIVSEKQGTQLSVDVESIEFISPQVALEKGVATVTDVHNVVQQTEYSAVHINQNGKWLLDRVSEEELPVVRSNYEHLKPLEWMIGTWVDQSDNASVETTCQWTRNKNFITRFFAVSIANRIDLSGVQIIGWDPERKRIRSWTFDSDGGFANGVWSQNGDQWSVSASSTLPGGGKASSVSLFTPVDENQFKWRSVNRMAAGELLPNIDEVVVVRSGSDE